MGAGPSNEVIPMSTPVQVSGAAQSSNLSKVVSVLAGRGVDANAIGIEGGYRQSALQNAVHVSNYDISV